ncbi:MAG: ketoacyl-ACP synthase III [Bacteroidota bacterium]
MRRNAVICSTGACLPQRVLPNAFFDEYLGTNVSSWLENNLQIYQRHWCAEDESTVDLCEQAALQALKRANLQAKDLDLIIVATDTPEYLTPATAAVLQDRLQAGHVGTFDLNAACAGFVMGLDVGAKYISTDERYNTVLVIGVYVLSKYLDMSDKKTVTLFGDGAGAVILTSEEGTNRGFLSSELMTLGQYFDGMGIYAGGTKHPITEEELQFNRHKFSINYRFPPELNPQVWTRMAKNLFARLDISAEDIQHYILTQLNINSIHKTLDNLKVGHERAHTAMQNYGYTGSACIPIALNDAVEKGKIKPDDLILMIGSGSGLTFGSVVFRY